MKAQVGLSTRSGATSLPYKINDSNTIKAEPKTLIWSERLEDGSTAILKMYYRMGPVSYIRKKILTFRAEREFTVLRHLDRKAIPCSKPLFWNYGYCREYGFHEILATRKVTNTIALNKFFESGTVTNKNIDLGPLFQAVGNMHQYGVYHGALSTKNILIDATDDDKVKYYIIDFSRALLFQDSISGKKIAWYDLLKLVRKIESNISIGYCQPYIVQYGLGKRAVRKFYETIKSNKYYSRKQKLTKNVIKVKVFFLAIFTKFDRSGNG